MDAWLTSTQNKFSSMSEEIEKVNNEIKSYDLSNYAKNTHDFTETIFVKLKHNEIFEDFELNGNLIKRNLDKMKKIKRDSET